MALADGSSARRQLQASASKEAAMNSKDSRDCVGNGSNGKETIMKAARETVRLYYDNDGAPEDDRHLREHVLRKRLLDLLDRLIIKLRQMQIC
jgi:hypothetical protein